MATLSWGSFPFTSHHEEIHAMPRKKASSDQPALAAILPPGPAELKIAAMAEQTKAAKRKLPKPAELTAMVERWKAHAQAVRDLLADVQAIAEHNWPMSDPDHEGNLAETISHMLRPFEVETKGIKSIEIDLTLAALLVDVQNVLDDIAPGDEQGDWAKEVLGESAATTTRVVGTPSKAKSRPKETK
jgi:hypothetical protein